MVDQPKVESVNEETVDELSPFERQKIAKSRISQMLIKREQQHIKNNGGIMAESMEENSELVLNAEYERVYEKVDNYGHYTTANDSRFDHEQHVPNTFEQGNSLHDHVQPTSLAEESKNENVDESSNHEVPRRKPMIRGNPLLIDELKKRQSTLYQADE